ncbi:MAG: DUF5131 family protein [Coriobacteriia bacterium]
MSTTTIEWTETTWNPVTGCTKISPGCRHCYAERMAKRLQAMGQSNYRDGFAVRTHEHMLRLPMSWASPRMVFVNSKLISVPAAVRFLSIEPLLEPLPDLTLDGIDWVIVGGESGPGARPIREEWILDIRDRCLAADVPFFFKQWGGVRKKAAGRQLQDRTWDEMPSMVGVA